MPQSANNGVDSYI